MKSKVPDGTLVVTLFGTVHVKGSCPNGRAAKWQWEGRNNLPGDEPCSDCLPDGLPDREPHQVTNEERARLASLAGVESLEDLRD
ncbi:hypothetical protein [Aeromicrobium piscarium]|uniref:Uncharacterized protein n=1 Tax=Aeromicrobium piscarium TaxID=2590901 RepID=A0A554SP07_9ACTN|nr:hypothetical protein [Aeromicrobium piscarium]TSD68092.1 hypothetical protein FNM00_00410 [Aeromicrobium piscarium]